MKRFISSLCALSILFACTQEEPAPIRVESIELDSEELELIEGNSISLVATILPEDAENQNVIWSSSNKAVASVKDGEVTALKVGEAVITATSEDGGKKATCKVVVSAKHIPVSSVTLDKGDVSLILEDKMTLTATVTPDNASNKTIVWTSSDESIVTVTDGEVTALKTGEAVITAKSADGDKKASCKVTVYAKPVPVTGVSLNKQKARVFINDELTLTATVVPEDATNKTLIWTTSNALVATVKNGVVKGISVGEADITVKTEDGNHSATCKVSVTEESQTQTKGPLTLDLGTVTSTTATFNGVLDIDMLGDYDMNAGGVGFIYAPADQPLNIVTSTKVQISEVDAQGKFTHTLTGLKYNSEYHYAIFVYKNTICQYGETQVFKTVPVDIELSVKDITQTRATISGRLTLPENDKELEVGVLCSTSSDMTIATEGVKKAVVTDIMDADGRFSHRAEDLLFDNTHYCRYYVKQGDTYTYGSVLDFKTEDVPVNLSVGEITQTAATISGNISLTEKNVLEVGLLYSSSSSDPKVTTSGVNKVVLTDMIDADGNFTYKAENLLNETTHYYRYYIKQGSTYTYGDVSTFKTEKVPVTIAVESIDRTVVTFKGNVRFSETGVIKIGVQYYPKSSTSQSAGIQTKIITKISENGDFIVEISGLLLGTEYYWQYYLLQNDVTIVGLPQTFEIADFYQSDLNMSSASDLSSSASANCYIISNSGLYKFKTVKGNSGSSVGNVASASILWETFGTSTVPDYLELIDGVCYSDGYIAFKTADTFKEGNAVVAAKDADGKILWSWHIWLTDQPRAQVYNNDARTMMDRNLGATSATSGHVGAHGLLYQWGRKDPFLGSSGISFSILAKSTITWPSPVSSDSSNGTIEYATAHPTTFITYNSSNYDWYYTGSSSTDNTRWTTSSNDKSIYDPCPAGWRVPDGGSNGIWSKAGFDDTTYNHTKEGMSFSISPYSTTWYPASGYRHRSNGSLLSVGGSGCYWSASPYNSLAYYLYFSSDGDFLPLSSDDRAYGQSVRCIRE